MAGTLQSQQANPLLGRPPVTYVKVWEAPFVGPQPKLAKGSGRTGNASQSGAHAALPAYVSEPDYSASPFTFSPSPNENRYVTPPTTSGVGDDGLHALNPTYRAHDFIVARYTFSQNRRAANWQEMQYPPSFRNLLQWQQAARYQIYNSIGQARPMLQSDYFLGYKIDPSIAADIGQTTLGVQ